MQSVSSFENKKAFLPTDYSLTNVLIKKVDAQLKSTHYVRSSVNLALFGFFAGLGSSIYHTVALAKTPVVGLKLVGRVTVFSLPVVGSKLDEKLPSLPKGFEYSAPLIHALKIVAYAFSAVFTPIFGLVLMPRLAVWLNQLLALAERDEPVGKPTTFEEAHEEFKPTKPIDAKEDSSPINPPVRPIESSSSQIENGQSDKEDFEDEAPGVASAPTSSSADSTEEKPSLVATIHCSNLELEQTISRLRPVNVANAPKKRENDLGDTFARGLAVVMVNGGPSAASSTTNSALWQDPAAENPHLLASSLIEFPTNSISDLDGKSSSSHSELETDENNPVNALPVKTHSQVHSKEESPLETEPKEDTEDLLTRELEMRRRLIASSGFDPFDSDMLDLSGGGLSPDILELSGVLYG